MVNGDTNDLCIELESYIRDDNYKESECKKFLTYAIGILVDFTTSRIIDQESEYRGHSGDSDYLIVCARVDVAGQECIEAYVWEAKAPQCFLFEPDTKARVRPTKEFISAENQLLHYFDELKGSSQFREEFNITSPDNVKLGGIVIGCRDRLVKPNDYSVSKAKKLSKRAFEIRMRHLYKSSGIEVKTWDDILAYLKGGEQPQRRDVQQRSVSITGTENVVTSND